MEKPLYGEKLGDPSYKRGTPEAAVKLDNKKTQPVVKDTNVEDNDTEGQVVQEERDSWGNQCEFFLSALGLAVGLGNVWRFPYQAYQNGSGTFLIPYFFMLFAIGITGLFLEQSLGQYAQMGVTKIYGRLAPIFRGFGYSVIVIITLSELYYAVICGWAFFYMGIGFQSQLPWATCADGELWHTKDCYTLELGQKCAQNNQTYWNLTCVDNTIYCENHNFQGYDTSNNMCTGGFDGSSFKIQDVLDNNTVSPAEDYFNGAVVGFTKDDGSGDRYSWYEFGSPRWQIVLCLAAVWLTENLILFKGLKIYGKMAYFITLSPYVVLTAFIAYGASLPGAIDGINHFLSPDFDKLWDIDVWYSAASQILLSLSLGMGSQVALSSYNKFTNNTLRDAFIIGIANSLTSLYAGFVVFAILGFLAHETATTVDKVVNDGITLAFVSYPSAMLKMNPAPFWNFMFFFMLINLAISSGCGGLQTIATCLMDEIPSLQKHRMKVFIGLSCALFLLGLPFCCNGGVLLFTLFDRRCSSSLLFILWIEVMVVSWVYGIGNFLDNIEEMGVRFGGKILKTIVKFVYLIVTPGILIVVVIIAWMGREPINYDNKDFPKIAEAFGWVLELGPLFFAVTIPLKKIWKCHQEGYSLKETARIMISPTEKWSKKNRDAALAAAKPKDNQAVDNLAFQDDGIVAQGAANNYD